MGTPTIISLLALFVSVISIPISYQLAIRRMKAELDEVDSRNQQSSRLLVAAAIEEFFKVFYSAVNEIAKVSPNELRLNTEIIDSYISEIDAFIINTHVLDRLLLSIDNLSMVKYGSLPNDIINRLLSIRNLIYLGSNQERSVTLGIINACDGDKLLDALKSGN